MRRGVVCLVVAASFAMAVLCGGCGVLFWPMVQRFPEPIRGVKVVDIETGKVVPTAGVSFELERHSGDTLRAAALRDPSGATLDGPAAPDREARRRLTGRRDTDGVFVFEPTRPLVWTRWFFPFRLAEGYTRYYDYDARIRATAPGYCPLVLTYAGRRPPLAGWSEAAGNGEARFDVDAILWFQLRKATARSKMD